MASFRNQFLLFCIFLIGFINPISSAFGLCSGTLQLSSVFGETAKLFGDNGQVDRIIDAVLIDELHNRHGYCLMNGSMMSTPERPATAFTLADTSRHCASPSIRRQINAHLYRLYSYAASACNDELYHVSQQRGLINPVDCIRRTPDLHKDEKWLQYDAFVLQHVVEAYYPLDEQRLALVVKLGLARLADLEYSRKVRDLMANTQTTNASSCSADNIEPVGLLYWMTIGPFGG